LDDKITEFEIHPFTVTDKVQSCRKQA